MQSLGYRNGRIRSTGDTHCLIYIATAGQGITDGTAQTGGSTTERLDLCRMVVGLVFEKYQPLFRYRSITIVHLNRYYNRTCIDLIGFFHIL